MKHELIKRYFPEITEQQEAQFEALGALYEEWNTRINVVSRKDMEHLYTRHILHSLAIAKVCQFEAGAKVIDIGCGGGFPSVPLAILFPEVEFVGVDSIGKKIRVVEGVRDGAKIENLRALNCRAESVGEKFDYVVSRAVTEMARFMPWAWPLLRKGERGTLPNGVLYLKGGELAEELAATRRRWDIYDIRTMFDDEFFETKKVVYTPYK
ncbi:MAG: 16S rRNA (guanine(527)-N(7))-methyltransferase RsmG [Alistipes sp.]|jgi:16S rRNA (guanine527-N7)-methyltransferase|nr:16S rRNA (guanine(527)-N(7))-methyltransferase RsmG [Alistipes sp.]MBQ5924477.1 16S rRNA (guanine(527)-N(7))-methyltransferase RsmG [Alistipes sp.]MEE1148987.1 16S rRNA (guanine(527)-N(7))-methyltransferase RsmG [Alistipes sp.]